MGDEVKAFAEDCEIKMLTSMYFYAQVNGQEKVLNRVIVEILSKILEKNPRD